GTAAPPADPAVAAFKAEIQAMREQLAALADKQRHGDLMGEIRSVVQDELGAALPHSAPPPAPAAPSVVFVTPPAVGSVPPQAPPQAAPPSVPPRAFAEEDQLPPWQRAPRPQAPFPAPAPRAYTGDVFDLMQDFVSRPLPPAPEPGPEQL